MITQFVWRLLERHLTPLLKDFRPESDLLLSWYARTHAAAPVPHDAPAARPRRRHERIQRRLAPPYVG